MKTITKAMLGVLSILLAVAGCHRYAWYLEDSFDAATACRTSLFRDVRTGMTKHQVILLIRKSDVEFWSILPEDPDKAPVVETWRIKIRTRSGSLEFRFDSGGKVVGRGCGGG